ncbi:MAG: cobalamin-binding protein [Pseudomonadota bacterium]|jgi:iron complex transport system substrate-binding protein
MSRYPCRIVCLTEETTETLYLLGEQERIAGISGYTVRPPRARREKPKISAFISAKTDAILALEPDLVLGFSDLQADIARDLVRAGLNVHIFNQRTVQGILDMISLLGAMVGASAKAETLVMQYQENLDRIRNRAGSYNIRPRVYFEEWPDPVISGIGWVSELVEIAGGVDCFGELSAAPLAKDRIIANTDEIIRRQPDIMIGSWCGRKFQPKQVRQRPGWDAIPAVRDGALFEIKSPEILQPGPAALTDGLAALDRIIRGWVEER